MVDTKNIKRVIYDGRYWWSVPWTREVRGELLSLGVKPDKTLKIRKVSRTLLFPARELYRKRASAIERLQKPQKPLGALEIQELQELKSRAEEEKNKDALGLIQRIRQQLEFDSPQGARDNLSVLSELLKLKREFNAVIEVREDYGHI